jgi:hypothetical protein
MRVRRDISSIPHRTASETWQRIIDLITGAGSEDTQQLQDATGVMGSLITDEHPARRPILVEGVGAQLRIYCTYGMRAIEDGSAVDALTWNPTAGDWTMHVPCDDENLAWVTTSLAKTSPRIKAFDVEQEEQSDDSASGAATKAASGIVIDWNIRC